MSQVNKFADAAGREWFLSLSVGMLRVVRERTGVELGKAMGSEKALAEILFTDPETLARVLWLLVEKQAGVLAVEPESFAEALDGATIERATEALLGAIVDFSPRSTISAAIKGRLPEMLNRMDSAAVKAVEQAMDRLASST